MKRHVLALATVAGVVAASLAVPAAAQAKPGSIERANTSTRTAVKFRSGTGIIRAKQLCESSSGQTMWWAYGPWVGINKWSTAGPCTNIRSRGYDTSNPV